MVKAAPALLVALAAILGKVLFSLTSKAFSCSPARRTRATPLESARAPTSGALIFLMAYRFPIWPTGAYQARTSVG